MNEATQYLHAKVDHRHATGNFDFNFTKAEKALDILDFTIVDRCVAGYDSLSDDAGKLSECVEKIMLLRQLPVTSGDNSPS